MIIIINIADANFTLWKIRKPPKQNHAVPRLLDCRALVSDNRLHRLEDLLGLIHPLIIRKYLLRVEALLQPGDPEILPRFQFVQAEDAGTNSESRSHQQLGRNCRQQFQCLLASRADNFQKEADLGLNPAHRAAEQTARRRIPVFQFVQKKYSKSEYDPPQ